MRRMFVNHILDDFEEICNGLTCCSSPQRTERSSDGLSISEDSENLYIDASLPGVSPEDVDITIDPKKRSLSICGESKKERESVKYHMKSKGQYCYAIPLSNEVDIETKVEAVSRDGIISITLPKNKGHKPLKVDVKTDVA